MENFVITIARQYGSGGRTVGRCWLRDWEFLFMVKRSFRWLRMRAVLM